MSKIQPYAVDVGAGGFDAVDLSMQPLDNSMNLTQWNIFQSPSFEHDFRQSVRRTVLYNFRFVMYVGAFVLATFMGMRILNPYPFFWLHSVCTLTTCLISWGLTNTKKGQSEVFRLVSMSVCLVALFNNIGPIMAAVSPVGVEGTSVGTQHIMEEVDNTMAYVAPMVMLFLSVDAKYSATSLFAVIVCVASTYILVAALHFGNISAMVCLRSVPSVFALVFAVISGYCISGFHRREFKHVKQILEDRHAILHMKKRKEMLLQAVLPADVVPRLLEGTIADRFNLVAVAFAEVCGLDRGQMADAVYVEKLEVFFDVCDVLCEEFGLLHLKTISNTFMAAAGVPTAQRECTSRMASFCSALLAAQDVLSEKLGMPIQVRVGMNAGPCVGGVIGSSRICYDIWGDCVNVAARMKTAAKVGTAVMPFALLDELPLHTAQDLGVKEIKGKGRMRVCQLQVTDHPLPFLSPKVTAATTTRRSLWTTLSVDSREVDFDTSHQESVVNADVMYKFSLKYRDPVLEAAFLNALQSTFEDIDKKGSVVVVIWLMISSLLLVFVPLTDLLLVGATRVTAVAMASACFLVGITLKRVFLSLGLLPLSTCYSLGRIYMSYAHPHLLRADTPLSMQMQMECALVQSVNMFVFHNLFKTKLLVGIFLIIAEIVTLFASQSEALVKQLVFAITYFVAGVLLARRLEVSLRRSYVASELARRDQLELERLQGQTHMLLQNILPQHLTVGFLEQEKFSSLVKAHSEASVLFADLQGFTAMSATLNPNDLVSILDAVFSSFDRLAQKRGLEKIKTIGDAWLCAGNVSTADSNHCIQMGKLGLEMQKALSDYNAKKHTDLRIRIGIDIGPVIAGAIGRRKFLFDVWGPPVAGAEELEGTAIPGRVHVSEKAKAKMPGLRFELHTGSGLSQPSYLICE